MKNMLIPLLITALRMSCGAQEPEKSFTVASGVFASRMVAAYRMEGPGSGSAGSQPLSSSTDGQAKPSSNAGNWAGSWTLTGSTFQDSSGVVISDVSFNSFIFELNAHSGGHTEEFTGKASVTGDRASYTDEERNCTLTFFLEDRTLTLNVSDGCMLAMGCVIEGAYRTDMISDAPTLKDLGVFETEIQEKTFIELVGDDASVFSNTMQMVGEEKDLDGFGARVRIGFVRGLARQMTAIVMINPEGMIWAAARDNDQVRYFTNDPASLWKLPRTIEQWRKDFPELRIEYVSADSGRKLNDAPVTRRR